jgi:drug/metabolite transporter superfamily protein YnfA
MARVPMSDVPATAFWALALLFVLGDSMAGTICGGLAAGAAILVRPNLVALAAVLGASIFWRWRRSGSRHALVRLIGFGAGLLPACLFVARMNTSLYGGPLTSGYGGASVLFSLSYVQTNLQRYGGWLIETQTPLALIGMLMLAMPSTRVWPTIESRRAALLLAFFTLGVWGAYIAYVPFNAWWFLRFLLPCWPAICLGTASLILKPLEARGTLSRAAAVVVVVALGLNGIRIALNHDVFPDDEGERRYATVAGLVEDMTEPSAIILTSEHAGPIRYYAGRLTLRSDLLDEACLDRAVDWLKDAGRHPYFLLEDWELPSFRKRFAGANVLGRLELSPLLAYESYQGPGTVYLFDPMQPAARTLEPLPIKDPRPRCALPARQPSYSLH